MTRFARSKIAWLREIGIARRVAQWHHRRVRLATILVVLVSALATRAEAGLKLTLKVPAPLAVAFASDGDAPGLARALDGMGLGSLAGAGEGIVITGRSLRTTAHQPLTTVNGSVIAAQPVAGGVDDAAWLALAQLEQLSDRRRSLVIVGHLVDDDGRTRLLTRAGSEGIIVREYADAAELALHDRPWRRYSQARELPAAPPPPPPVASPVVGACVAAPSSPARPLPQWPAFALLGLAGALALRVSRRDSARAP